MHASASARSNSTPSSWTRKVRIRRDDLAVVGLLHQALLFQDGDRLVDRRLGDAELLGDVDRTDPLAERPFALKANHALEVILVCHGQVQLAGNVGGFHMVVLSVAYRVSV